MRSTLAVLGSVAAVLLVAVSVAAASQEERLPSGVTARVVTYYSEGVACYGRIFFPRGFDVAGAVPGVVLANGWTGTAGTLERYAERFAERGLVAMALDYRGWGKSGGFVTLAEEVESDDRLRITQATQRVKIERTRLLPLEQVTDIRNAIGYLQGEPGVDRNRIGLWGTSYAGGHVITAAATDGRVKVGVAQVPAIPGKNLPESAVTLPGPMLEQAIRRARTGEDEDWETGFSRKVTVGGETRQAAFEYRPFHLLDEVPASVPILFIVAENEELMDNQEHAFAAAEALAGPTEVRVIEGITHFQVYRDEAFEEGAEAAADWFLKHL